MKKVAPIFFFMLSIFLSSQAQAQCRENLTKARDNFDAGNFYGIPALLNECLKKGTRQDKIAAYRLLTITYLYIDDPRAAQISFIQLLELDPEYKPDSTEYVELVHLSKEYITTPIVTWRLRAGINTSFVTVLQQNGSNNPTISNDTYGYKAGFNALASMDIGINKYFTASLEPELSFDRFTSKSSYFNDVNGLPDAKDQASFTEKSLQVSLPVSVRFTWPGNTYSPYIYSGYSPNFTFFTLSDASYVKNENQAQTFTNNKNLNITDLRKQFSNSAVFGIGLKRRVNLNYVFVDVRFKIGLQDLLNTKALNNFDKNKDINTYTTTYLQRDNNFRQNQVNLTIGYAWPSYYARRKGSLNFKSFMRGIFKPKSRYE